MIESMTGFGRGEAYKNGTTVSVEMRSVNNRFCEVTLKMPSLLQQKEHEFRDLIQKNFERGKFNIQISLESSDTMGPALVINKKAVSSYKNVLDQLREVASINETVNLEHFLHFNDLFTSREVSDEEVKLVYELAMNACQKAIGEIRTMRRQEGKYLADDMLKRLTNIGTIIENVRSIASGRIDDARTRFRDRIAAMVTDESFDPERLELEIAILADKLDITEELVRLDAHLKFFTEAMQNKEASGRKLNFLLQEMLREINTIGSKSYNADIAHHVVNVKETLEKIREQVQNIE
ncbi:MAG: YicC/YloC family endoribonuclease [Cyclonatronaceae bacterium]